MEDAKLCKQQIEDSSRRVGSRRRDGTATRMSTDNSGNRRQKHECEQQLDNAQDRPNSCQACPAPQAAGLRTIKQATLAL
jgi:hypothetical protein